jgi:hypothetical protein
MVYLRLYTALAASAAALAFAAPASAALCTAGGATLTIGATTYTSTLCRDDVDNGSPAQETGNLENAFGFPDGSYAFLGKSDSSDPDTFAGIDFDVTATGTNVGGDSAGTFTVTWTEAAGAPDLPAVFDFVVGLFGGNGPEENGAGYFFDNVLLPLIPNTGTGTFDIAFTNPGGNEPNLSHLTLIGSYQGGETDVPEPAMIGLLGLGILGLAAACRRRFS